MALSTTSLSLNGPKHKKKQSRFEPMLLYISLVWNLSFCVALSSKTYPFVYHSRLKPIFLYTTLVSNLSFRIPLSFNWTLVKSILTSWYLQKLLVKSITLCCATWFRGRVSQTFERARLENPRDPKGQQKQKNKLSEHCFCRVLFLDYTRPAWNTRWPLAHAHDYIYIYIYL